MLEGFTPLPIENFRGVYWRGSFPQEIPPNFAYDANNIIFDGNGIARRLCITNHLTYNAAVGTPVRLHIYNKSDGVRFLLMDHLGKIFDITAGGASPLLDFASGTDFSVITMFDRAYITPHDRDTGVASEKLYVYDGTTTRAAAGTKPSTGLLAATGAAGSVSIGVHIISFAFETDTGFITKYATPIAYTAPGAAKIDLTSIDTGPSGTVKRHILVSKAIGNYDGNVDNYELFFVDKINDNSGTTKTIDFVDSALASSGKYLLDQLETIPAGVFLCEHEGSLVVGGEQGATAPVGGTDTTDITINVGERGKIRPPQPAVPIVNPTGSSLARVSKSGNPESFNAVSGWVSINPDGGGLKNGRSYKGNLYLFKSARTYVTWNTGGEPSTWPIQLIDSGQGCECFGIAELDTSKGHTQDYIFILNKNGLWSFDGHYGSRSLSWNISRAVYEPTSQTSYVATTSEVITDPTNKYIYLNILAATTPAGFTKVLWAGSYENGLDWESIRWVPWQFRLAGPITPIITSIKCVNGVLYFASSDSNKLWKQNSAVTSDDTVEIEHSIDVPVPLPHTGGVYKLAGVELVMKSTNDDTTLAVTAFDMAGVGTSLNLTDVDSVPNQNYFAQIDLESEFMRIKVSLTASRKMFINRIIPYVKKVWSIRPL